MRIRFVGIPPSTEKVKDEIVTEETAALSDEAFSHLGKLAEHDDQWLVVAGSGQLMWSGLGIVDGGDE